jgi:hypothetical protein
MVAKQWGNILAHGQGPDRGILTIDVDDGTSLTWENKTNGKKLEVANESIWEIYWRNYPSGCKLTLVLDAGAVALFTGFKSKVRARVLALPAHANGWRPPQPTHPPHNINHTQ